MKIKVEFSGGLDLLFANQKQLGLEFADRTDVPLKEVLATLRDKHLKERPELFLKGDTVRPGILVLINECDWELCDGIAYQVQDGDTLVFISTLHGG